MTALTGKVAIATGSSRGIGWALAERLGRDGARVVVTYAGNRDKAEAVVSTIRASGRMRSRFSLTSPSWIAFAPSFKKPSSTLAN